MSRASTPASLPGRAAGPYRLPDQIGPFTVRAQVGWGGTAFTFVGSEPAGGAARLKCLKIPSPQLLLHHSPAQIREIFGNEAAVLRLLPPANIAPLERVVELGDEQGVMCLVYTFIDGIDLGRLLDKTRERRELLPWQAVAGIARDLAGALEEAHTDRRGEPTYYDHPRVIHRDVAPSNVMLDIRGNAFLIDFGFARTMDASHLRASRAHPGRIAYCAPEYFARDGSGGGTYDPRLDLFSTGALLFEALTGRQAFRGRSVQEHIEQACNQDRARIEELRPEFHRPAGPDPELEALASIVDCLLEPDPDARFQSAGALLSALNSLRVSIDQRPLGAMVTQHQSPWQHRVTESRVDRGPITGRVRVHTTGQTALHAPAAPIAVPPEEILIDEQAANELDQLVLPFPPHANELDLASTQPDPPLIPITRPTADDAVPFPATNPSRDAIDAVPFPATNPSREAIDAVPFPATNPSREAIDASEPSGVRSLPSATPAPPALAPVAPATPAPAPTAPQTTAPLAQMPPPHPFTVARTQLPTYPTSPEPAEPHGRRMRTAAAAIVALLFASLFVLGSVNTLWVPLLTGQLGWTVIDGFWTPLLTSLGMLGVAVATASALALALAWAWTKRKTKTKDPP